MAAEIGESCHQTLIIALLVIGAVACGAVYVALTSGPVVVKRADTTPPSRTLAYEQQINRDGTPAPASSENAPEQQAAAPAEQPQAAARPTRRAASTQGRPLDGIHEMAALPHSGEVTFPSLMRCLGRSPAPQMQGEGPDGASQMDGRATIAMAALPGEDADPNACPPGPDEEPQEWVQVLVSGAGMHGAASEDAPALFAFPYGRNLRVVSRYEGWVEVTDPQSAATGWMKAQYLCADRRPAGCPKRPRRCTTRTTSRGAAAGSADGRAAASAT